MVHAGEQQLCELCSSISLSQMRGPGRDQTQTHQPSYFALKRSAEGGCRLCQFIWKALELDSGRGTDEAAAALAHVSEQYLGREISLDAWGQGQGWLDRIRVTTTGEVPDLDSDDESDGVFDPTMHPDHQIALSGMLDLYAYPDDAAAWHGEIRGRPLPRTSGSSKEDWELVYSWLKDCHEHHNNCPKADKPTSLPTRVLDVGPVNGSHVEPYLLETLGKKGQYMALSHCWGGKVPLTTTLDTLSLRKTCIPMASLPQTFHDAVIITRRLGIRYLWIDSLCIIQDSKSDWATEAALMADVYGQSWLTIAARGAPNSSVGCFIEREMEPRPCRLEYVNPDGSAKGSMFIRDPRFPMERVDTCPLDQRGWVLQERLLSPRVLDYGSQQLYWECNTVTARQDGKYFMGYENTVFGEVNSKRMLSPQTPLNPMFQARRGYSGWNQDEIEASRMAQLARKEYAGRWYLTVSEYSRRSLSFASDRLPALAGIAKEFHRATGYKYIAGLWREDLLNGLLWFRKPARVENEPCSASTLPTWSWACTDGRISFASAQSFSTPFLDFYPACDLIDVSYRATGGLAEYGEVQDARLCIRGQVIPVVYRAVAGEHYFPPTIMSYEGLKVGRIFFDTECDKYDGHKLFCLLVDLTTRKPDYGASGLALKLVNGETNIYQRIGYITMVSETGESTSRVGRAVFRDVIPQMLTLV